MPQNVEGEGITEVFAIIKPPDYISGSPDDPVMDLPKIELSPMGNRYQGTYGGFTLLFYRNSEIPAGLYWQMDMNTFEVK